MASSIVVKVRYGDTLRRFNANLNEAGQLEMDIGGLREKVLGLFNLAPNSDITITYKDEDDDVVTLVDEEDLRDVITQSLNPLYLTVKCNTENLGTSNVSSRGSSTPVRSPRVQQPPGNLNNNVSELLKSVPEPFREPIAKLSLGLASKAATNNNVSELLKSVPEPFREPIAKLSVGLASKAATNVPGLADLVDSLTKMGQLHVDGSKSRDMNVASGSGIAGSQAKMPGASRDVKASAETAPETKSQQTTKANHKEDIGNVADGTASHPSNANAGLPFVPSLPTDAKNVASGRSMKKVARSVERRAVMEAGKLVNPKAESIIKDAKKSGKEWSYFTPGVYPACAGKDRLVGPGFSGSSSNLGVSTEFPGLDVVNECPFTGTQIEKDSVVSGAPFFQPQLGAHIPSFKRSYNNNDGLGSIFHRGVRCDGCGVHPITGPRFKSKVKEDYDLCSVCFSQMGNAMDYIRMDRPATYHHPHSFKGSYEQYHQFRIPTLPQIVRGSVVRGAGIKPLAPKLDSRFVKDVNVLDGTIMAPSTPFTKIWRMKNNGSAVWPRGSQLVWIGGDNLCGAKKVELQIQSDEVAVDGELDVAVDFTAPKNPGRYISYWRMASPSGQKFGQRVWVLIQVDASLEDSLLDSFQGLNLNLPPEGSNEASPEYQNVKSEPLLVEPANVTRKSDVLESLLGASSDRATELVEPLVVAAASENEKLPSPIHLDSSLFGEVVSTAPPAVALESPKLAYPVVDSSAVEQPESSNVASTSNEVPESVVDASGSSDLEQSLLRELQDMGFTQPDLNKEILRMNGYNLEKSVDDLCGVSEWDPMLEELKDMGFSDQVVNRRLLKKNNGSIKGVVMDLITGEKYD